MRGFVIILLNLWISPLIYAETITIDADTFELIHDEKRSEFTGNVTVYRGDMLLKSDFMTIIYHQLEGRNALKSAKATGNVIIETPEHHGFANEATFSSASEMLILAGNAKVMGKEGDLVGEQIEYNTKTKATRLLKGKVDQQVRFTFGEENSE